MALTNEKIVSAWKNSEIRDSFTAEEKAEWEALGEEGVLKVITAEAGSIELTDEELENATGGVRDSSCFIGSC